jgi:hypothetical protein
LVDGVPALRRTSWEGGDQPRRTDRYREDDGVAGRLESGAIVDEITTDDGQTVTVRFQRCPAGWQATFELSHPGARRLGVAHRLVTETLAEARASVPEAVAFLLGTPIDQSI